MHSFQLYYTTIFILSKYKNGVFYNKSGTIAFTVKNLQTQYISKRRPWWDQFGMIHNN